LIHNPWRFMVKRVKDLAGFTNLMST